jgi:O-antigen/teichoic acid export membrane protein
MNLLKKVIDGGAIFLVRQVFSTIIGVVLSISLTRLLLPSDFGFISFVTIALGVLSLFSDGGLGLYLIQKKDEITSKDISFITNIQLVIYFVFEFLFIIGAFFVTRFSIIDVKGLIYLFVASFSVPFAIFKGGSIILLERKLDFNKIAFIEISEQLLYAFSAIFFTFLGFGVWGIVFSILIKVIGSYLVSIKFISWNYNFRIKGDLQEIKKVIKIGISYQFPAILETFRSAINPIFIGTMFGLTYAGFTDRAILIASIPTSLLGSVWQKVLFPVVARIQNNKHALENLFQKSVYLHSIFDKALYLPLFLLGNSFVSFFIGEKWLPSLPIVYIFALGNIFFSSYSTTGIAFLKGMGMPKILAYWSIIQLPLALISIVFFSNFFGYVGYAIGSQMLWFGIFYSYPTLRSKLNIVCFRAIFVPLISFLITYLVFQYFLLDDIFVDHFILTSILIEICYFSVLYVFDYKKINELFTLLRSRNSLI